MQISASIKSSKIQHQVTVSTNDVFKNIHIPAKAEGNGSSVNGGELLFLALATCFCNDAYREAAKRNINIQSISVTVNGEFGKEGEPGKNIHYHTTIEADADDDELRELIQHVDAIAEVHKTLRLGTSVTLETKDS